MYSSKSRPQTAVMSVALPRAGPEYKLQPIGMRVGGVAHGVEIIRPHVGELAAESPLVVVLRTGVHLHAHDVFDSGGREIGAGVEAVDG